MLRILVAFLLCVSTISAAANKQHQAIIPSPKMLSLLDEAKKMMNYTDKLPELRMYSVSDKELQKMFCGPSKCTVTAIYTDGKMYFDQDLDINHPIWKSIILHEMVHHIQYAKVGGTVTCDMWYKKEREAYHMQAAYLRKLGVSDKVVIDTVKNIKCPE